MNRKVRKMGIDSFGPTFIAPTRSEGLTQPQKSRDALPECAHGPLPLLLERLRPWGSFGPLQPAANGSLHRRDQKA